MAIPIRQSNQELMTLYKIETVHVPVSLKDDTKNYTKIKMNTDYIGIDGENFV